MAAAFTRDRLSLPRTRSAWAVGDSGTARRCPTPAGAVPSSTASKRLEGAFQPHDICLLRPRPAPLPQPPPKVEAQVSRRLRTAARLSEHHCAPQMSSVTLRGVAGARVLGMKLPLGAAKPSNLANPIAFAVVFGAFPRDARTKGKGHGSGFHGLSVDSGSAGKIHLKVMGLESLESHQNGGKRPLTGIPCRLAG